MRLQDDRKRHWLIFSLAVSSILLAGLISARILGLWLAANQTVDYFYQVHRFHEAIATNQNTIQPADNFVVLGDSLASGNLPLNSSVTGTAISFAVHGGTVLESYYMLRRYLEVHPAPPCLVLMTSYGAGLENFPKKFWPIFVARNFYGAADLDDLYEVSSRSNSFPAREWSYPLYRFKIFSTRLLNLFEWHSFSSMVFQPITSRLARRIFRKVRIGQGSLTQSVADKIPNREYPFSGPYQDHLAQPFKANPLIDSGILRLAKIEKSRLLILVSPIAKSLRTPASERWLQDLNIHLNQLTAGLDNVTIKMDQLWDDDIKFFDATHLDHDSAIEYMRIQLPAIKSCASGETQKVETPNLSR